MRPPVRRHSAPARSPPIIMLKSVHRPLLFGHVPLDVVARGACPNQDAAALGPRLDVIPCGVEQRNVGAHRPRAICAELAVLPAGPDKRLRHQIPAAISVAWRLQRSHNVSSNLCNLTASSRAGDPGGKCQNPLSPKRRRYRRNNRLCRRRNVGDAIRQCFPQMISCPLKRSASTVRRQKGMQHPIRSLT